MVGGGGRQNSGAPRAGRGAAGGRRRHARTRGKNGLAKFSCLSEAPGTLLWPDGSPNPASKSAVMRSLARPPGGPRSFQRFVSASQSARLSRLRLAGQNEPCGGWAAKATAIARSHVDYTLCEISSAGGPD